MKTSAEIVRKIIEDLKNINGLSDTWYSMDDETRNDLSDRWEYIADQVINKIGREDKAVIN